MRPVVTLIGAGSTVFTAELVTDFLTTPGLEEGEFRFVDIDGERLELVHRFADLMVERSQRSWAVKSSTERIVLLEGSDVIVNVVEVGGLANVRHDYEIPLRYGVDQCFGDTIGPGGLFKALRTIPVWLQILADIEELAPNALVLTHTNPMSMMVLASSRTAQIPVYGMCTSVDYTIQKLGGYLGVDPHELEFRSAGVNHLAWVTELSHKGQDMYPVLAERGRLAEIYEQDPVRFELMYHLGAFPTETSGHVSEYVPYFRSSRENLDRYTRPGHLGESGFYANNWPRWRLENDAMLRRVLAGEERYPVTRGIEYPSHIVEAIASGSPATIHVNVPNRGLIDNLPEGGVVEVRAFVDAEGIHPVAFGSLPEQLAALDRRHMDVHELAVRSILDEDRESAVHALMMDPLTSAVCAPAEIRSMFDEMVGAQRAYLPDYLE